MKKDIINRLLSLNQITLDEALILNDKSIELSIDEYKEVMINQSNTSDYFRVNKTN
jgi:hypothetical protein